MRNLKKILALALVFAMAFTFTAGAAADFTDAASIDADYADDVNMLVELGVIAGYPDGSFGPEKNITRAEFAKMAYTIIYGSDTDGNLFAAQKSNFWDVEGNANVAWAKGYINYCANQKIVSGVGGGKFNPQGNITVAEASKMLLVILGCDPAKEGFTGANWMSNVVAKAMELGVYDGWKGDPSSLATRELVAKLMANTILSSVYTYSSITGIGSQKDALGQYDNETLGQKTMNLSTVTGIVVANERYALDTDDEGNYLVKTLTTPAPATYTEEKYIGDTIEKTREDESMVLYETKEKDGSTIKHTITLDRALPDEMLGSKVNVFFKADKKEEEKSGVISYVNIKVIGDVIVNNDTVVHEVPAVAVDMYPNGQGSSVKVQPYIGFTTADGEEVKIVAKDNVIVKEAKDVDIATSLNVDTAANYANVQNFFNKYVYDFRGADDANITWALNSTGGAATVTNFYNNMGLNATYCASATSYRFVSVDGGKTYSYMFKLYSGEGVELEAVTAYNEARGTIKVTGNAAFDIEDCIIEEGIAVNDYVVVYNANGKTVIEKADVVTGSVEALGDDKSVTIGGNKYWAVAGLTDLGGQTLTRFYTDYPAYISANLTYYTYNNIILDIDTDVDVEATVDNYAVIVNNWYDSQAGTAHVKLGFADGTMKTYEVGKLFVGDGSAPNNPNGSGSTRVNDVMADFNNSMVGRVVRFKVLDNGTLDLSEQFLHESSDSKKNFYATGSAIDIAEGKVISGDTRLATPTVFPAGDRFALNDASILFVVYGRNAAENAVKVYKLSDIEALNKTGDPNVVSGMNVTDGYIVYNKNLNQSNRYVVAASVVSTDSRIQGIGFEEAKKWSYIVSAKQKYNYMDRTYAVDFTLIDNDGLKNISTIYDVKDFNSGSFGFDGQENMKLDGKTELSPAAGGNPAVMCLDWFGGFVRYETNAEGLITMMEVEEDSQGIMSTNKTGDTTTVTLHADLEDQLSRMTGDAKTADGFYLVNIVGERNGAINFFDVMQHAYTLDTDPASATVNKYVMTLTNAIPQTIKYHADGYNIIGITEGEYDGDKLYTISSTQDKLVFEDDGANAIVEIYEGKVKTIYSFSDPIDVDATVQMPQA